jgi:hypothetical protein
MNQKICVTSWRSMGCTFIDWSIHFLSGQTRYYNASANGFIELSQNPINNINSHGHNKNHPLGYVETKKCLEIFDNLTDQAICSMYAAWLPLDSGANILNVGIEQLHDPNVMTQVQQTIANDYNKIFELCYKTNTKIIYVAQDDRMHLYHQSIRSHSRFMTRPGQPNSLKELTDEMQQVFFQNSLSRWQDLNLTNVWDIRERMALDSRPFAAHKSDTKITYPHHWVSCLSLWTRTEESIANILKYLDLEIDAKRLEQWLPICKQWQKMQTDILEFCYNQPHIIDAIVNNLDFSIDLTFDQEVIIQHCLIYQHGLNLKTWQLKKFPSNTQELHKLLEPNIHPVPVIY